MRTMETMQEARPAMKSEAVRGEKADRRSKRSKPW